MVYLLKWDLPFGKFNKTIPSYDTKYGTAFVPPKVIMNFPYTIISVDSDDSSFFTTFIYKEVPYPDPHEKIMICHVSFDYIRLPSHKIQIDFEHETIK